MKQVSAIILALGLCVPPATAQEAEVEEGFSLMQEGARLLMRGLMAEVEPTISDLRDSLETMGPAIADFTQRFGPALTELIGQVDDLRYYDAPELLPNGDIILRRMPDAPEFTPDAAADAPPAEIDL